MLAALPPAHVHALYPNIDAFGRGGDRGPQSLASLRRLLTDVRHHGYSTEYEEVAPGSASAAMAVFDRHGFPLAAVAVTIVDEIRATARELGRRISD